MSRKYISLLAPFVGAFFCLNAYAGDPVTAVDSSTLQPKPVYQTGNAMWVTLQGSSSTPAGVTIESATGDSIINDTADAMNVVIKTPNGDSAMDDTADAVKVLNYVSENNVSSTDVAVAASGFTTVLDIDTGATQSYNLMCWWDIDADGSNVDDADGLKIFIVPYGVTIGANTPVTLGGPAGTTSADFTNPNPELVNFVRTTDGDADPTTLDEGDEAIVSLKVPGSSQVRIQMSLNNDGVVDINCTHD